MTVKNKFRENSIFNSLRHRVVLVYNCWHFQSVNQQSLSSWQSIIYHRWEDYKWQQSKWEPKLEMVSRLENCKNDGMRKYFFILIRNSHSRWPLVTVRLPLRIFLLASVSSAHILSRTMEEEIVARSALN